MLPKYNAIVNLKDFDFNKLDYKLQNKINKINNKGLNFIKGDIYNISDVYEFIKRKEDASESFYNAVYKNFSEKNMIDLFLIEVNYHEYLSNLQNIHSIETLLNEKLNKIFQMNPKDKNLYIEKMKSDTKITNINKEISSINEKIQQGIFKEIIGGALVIKQNNIASIFISGFNKNYNKVLPNHFMHYMILTHYKALNYSYVDLNGITGDFSDDNPYKALNTFKLGWNPKVYEYIGEFDFIIKDTTYALLWSTKKLHKEFEKPNLKVK